jgi:dipeptidase E
MKKCGTIIAVSGYNLRETTYIQDPQIDKFILEHVPNRKRVLYVPTASHDNPDYCFNFNRIYSEVLGCQVDNLFLYSTNYSSAELDELVKWYDLIYVGWGDTARMMKKWRAIWFDQVLLRYHQSWWVLAGMSAGASCWFDCGITDSLKYCRAIGIVHACLRPHYQLEQEAEIFRKAKEKYAGMTFGLADYTAFVRKNDKDLIRVFKNKLFQEVFYKQDWDIQKYGAVLDEGTYIFNIAPSIWANFQKVS